MKTTSFVKLALLVACAAQFIQAEPADCTARQGPGCVQVSTPQPNYGHSATSVGFSVLIDSAAAPTVVAAVQPADARFTQWHLYAAAADVNCISPHVTAASCVCSVRMTITAPDGHQHHEGGHGDSRSESYRDSHSSHNRGGWRGGRRLKHGGPPPDSDRSRVVCVACNTGYVLATRPNSTYGSCRCAPGWGSQPVNSSSTDAPWWEHRRGSFKCVDCSAEGKVPLTDKANLKLSWDGSSWVLVLASPPQCQQQQCRCTAPGRRAWLVPGLGGMGGATSLQGW